MKIYLIILGIGFATLKVSADYKADIYEIGSNRSKKIFVMTHHAIEKNGITNNTTTYSDLAGNVAVEESSQFKGAELIKLEIEQKQIGAKATVENKDSKIFFTKTANGKTKTDEEKIKGSFVISATFVNFVKAKWSEILKGKEVEFRYGSWERMETVGFEIKKIAEEKIGDQQAVVIKMKPSSFIIAAIVNPLTFKFSADGSRILEMSGRVAPKQKVWDSWKDLDAEMVYRY